MTAKQQHLYRLYLAAPPTGAVGTTLVVAYRLGLNNPDRVCRYSRSSLCYATWRAGRHHAKRGSGRKAA